MRLFFEGFEGCCLFGLCDAMLFALFLSRLAVNKIGAEGAGRLAEPLGRRPWMQPPSGGLWDLVPCTGRTC
jgi:hypothetical protein